MAEHERSPLSDPLSSGLLPRECLPDLSGRPLCGHGGGILVKSILLSPFIIVIYLDMQ
jgi:hypothetical protein